MTIVRFEDVYLRQVKTINLFGMRRVFATACAVLLAVGASAAAPDNIPAADSLSIGEVVITGTRNRTDIRHLPMTVTVVDRAEIENSMQKSLLPLLSEQVPGLFVTQRGVLGYGVSDGAAGGISLRGLSGGAGRLMVLIDGHPQYMGLFGHPIGDAYQSFMAERVEVLRGPASVLYGSNAMGGVVNIVTRKMNENGVRTDITAGYGSYNTLQTEIVNRLRVNRFSSILSFSYDRTDGHRPDMGFRQYGGYAKLGYDISRAWSVRADIDVTHFDASNPGAVTALLAEADQRVTRGMVSAAVENDYGRTSGGVSLFHNWGAHEINDGYIIGQGSPRAYLFNSRDRMTGVSLYQSVQLFAGNRLTAGLDFYDFGGRAWNAYFRDVTDGEGKITNAAGSRADIADVSEYEIAGYVDFRQHVGRWLTLDAGLRLDRHSRSGTEWVPQFGASFHLPHGAEIKLSAAKGCRDPNRREMYMVPPQTPDLLPESMWNYELAISQTAAGGRLSWGVNIFYIDGKNMIVTVPREGATPLNMNTGRIENCGVEATLAYRISPSWSLDANYSYLHMENPVIAAPEHKAYAGVSFARRRWEVSTGLQYINTLYTSVSPVVTENFALWNVRASFRAARWISLWVRGDNLLAQRYEINAGYPMPRATVIGGVRLNF